jgi:hypothetical protein
MEIQKNIDRLNWFERYFSNNVKNDILFEPEFEAAKEINLIARQEELRQEDFLRIIEIFNVANNAEHYNGSGWMDFRLHIQGMIRAYGLDVIIVNGNIVII